MVHSYAHINKHISYDAYIQSKQVYMYITDLDIIRTVKIEGKNRIYRASFFLILICKKVQLAQCDATLNLGI